MLNIVKHLFREAVWGPELCKPEAINPWMAKLSDHALLFSILLSKAIA